MNTKTASLIILGVFGNIFALSTLLSLISEPSDIAVAVGVLLLIFIIFVNYKAIEFLIKKR